MYLRYLTADQKKALLVLAYHMVIADGTVSDEESNLLDELKHGLGVDAVVTPQAMYERPSLAVFDSRRAKMTALVQILALAFADNLFPTSESDMVRDFTREIGIAAEEMPAIEDWVRRQNVMVEEFETLLAGNG